MKIKILRLIPQLIKSLPMRTLRAALLFLASGLIVTALLTLSTKADVEAVAKQEFDFASSQITQKIEARLIGNIQLINSAGRPLQLRIPLPARIGRPLHSICRLKANSRAFRTWATRPSLI
ncbi:MAG: hypothetical protein WCK35_14225 [Chloroflexota bacterium]